MFDMETGGQLARPGLDAEVVELLAAEREDRGLWVDIFSPADLLLTSQTEHSVVTPTSSVMALGNVGRTPRLVM